MISATGPRSIQVGWPGNGNEDKFGISAARNIPLLPHVTQVTISSGCLCLFPLSFPRQNEHFSSRFGGRLRFGCLDVGAMRLGVEGWGKSK